MNTSHATRAKDLKVGNQIFSQSSQVWRTVTKVQHTANKSIVILDGDFEIDFQPYAEITAVK